MPYHLQAWSRFFAGQGLTLTLDEVKAHVFGKTNAEILRAVLGEPLSAHDLAAHVRHKEDMYRSLYLPQLRPIPGLLDFLSAARDLSLPMALATSAGKRNIGWTLDSLGIRTYFRVIVGADDIQRGKPDPEIFLTAAERLRLAPARCLVFEDSLFGLEAAHRAGMRAVALTTTHTRVELERLPGVIRVTEDYRGLQPAELLNELS
jgi:HAD superfamily hydrolase (TIGR01509 family)